jgi:chloramphenicol 3-O-phosphotransferase
MTVEDMKLIILYGPPAAGKLTIATALADLIEYKVLDMHMINDLVYTFFPDGVAYRWLTQKMKFQIIQIAAQQNMPGLILTYGYHANVPSRDRWVKSVMNTVDRYGGSTHFVYVTAPEDILAHRAPLPSRQKKGKIVDPELCKQVVRKRKYIPIPFVESLHIDSSKYSPYDAACLIKQYYNL